jgi:hypothetical protein
LADPLLGTPQHRPVLEALFSATIGLLFRTRLLGTPHQLVMGGRASYSRLSAANGLMVTEPLTDGKAFGGALRRTERHRRSLRPLLDQSYTIAMTLDLRGFEHPPF